MRRWMLGLALTGTMFLAGVLAGQDVGLAAEVAPGGVKISTIAIDGVNIAFAAPPGYCQVPQNSSFAPMFYSRASQGALPDTNNPVTLRVMVAFLPCEQLDNPQMGGIVAYQTWAVATRYGSVLHVDSFASGKDMLKAMYTSFLSDDYRKIENQGLQALGKVFGPVDIAHRQDASGMRDQYFYRVYKIPADISPSVQQICGGSGFVTIGPFILRNEQLAPCREPTVQDVAASMIGQMDYFVASNVIP